MIGVEGLLSVFIDNSQTNIFSETKTNQFCSGPYTIYQSFIRIVREVWENQNLVFWPNDTYPKIWRYYNILCDMLQITNYNPDLP